MKIRSIKSLLLSPCALTFSFLVLILFSCSKDSDGTGFSGDSGDGEIPPVVNPEDVLPEEVDGNVIVYHTLNSNVLIFEDSTVFGDLKILSNTYSSSSNYGKIVFDGDVTIIGDDAFNSRKFTESNFENLSGVVLPNTVVNIGDHAFDYCRALQYVDYCDEIVSLGDYAFYGCSKLKLQKLPDSLQFIGDMAFRNCMSLTKVTVPDGVTELGTSTFENCYSLYSLKLPEQLT